MKTPIISLIFASLLVASNSHAASAQRQTTVTVYSSPEMNLGEVERTILDQVGAGAYVNFAAFVLSDNSVIDSLRAAAERGAKIRVYLDPRELERLNLFADHPFVKLWRTRGVEVRVKNREDGLMHLKAYSINGTLLRTGSANESYSGLERQDNDLVIISDRDAVMAFDRKFDAMWNRPSNTKFSYP